MLTVLLQASTEKLINLAIASDEITKAGLAPLAGKVLRLDMGMPELHLDVLFTHERLRFEPVSVDSVFEPSGHMDERQKASMERARIGHSRPRLRDYCRQCLHSCSILCVALRATCLSLVITKC